MSNVSASFRDYLRLQVTLEELARALGEGWRFVRDGENYTLEPGSISIDPIRVEVSHLRNAINTALGGLITADALQNWANLLLLFEGYEIGGSGEVASEYIRQTLHELATPSIYRRLSADTLSTLLDAADRLEEK